MFLSWSQSSLLDIVTVNIAAMSITIASSFKFRTATSLLTVIELTRACWANWAFLSFHGQKGMMVVCGRLL